MSTTDDLITSPDIVPADTPLRGKRAKIEASPVAAAPSTMGHAPTGFPLTVHVGTPTPVVLVFPTYESRAKAVQQLIQRATKLPTSFTLNGVTTTFLYITHFTYEG